MPKSKRHRLGTRVQSVKFEEASDAWLRIRGHQEYPKLVEHGHALPSQVLELAEKHGVHFENILRKWGGGHRLFQLIMDALEKMRPHVPELDRVEQEGAGLTTSPIAQMFHDLLGARAREIPAGLIAHLDQVLPQGRQGVVEHIRKHDGNILTAIQALGLEPDQATTKRLLEVTRPKQPPSWLLQFAECIHALGPGWLAAQEPSPAPSPAPEPPPEPPPLTPGGTMELDVPKLFSEVMAQVESGADVVEIDVEHATAVWLTISGHNEFRFVKFKQPTKFCTFLRRHQSESVSVADLLRERGVRDEQLIRWIATFYPALNAWRKDIARCLAAAKSGARVVSWEDIKRQPALKQMGYSASSEDAALAALKKHLPDHDNSVGKLVRAKGVLNGRFVLDLMAYLRSKGVAIREVQPTRAKAYPLTFSRSQAAESSAVEPSTEAELTSREAVGAAEESAAPPSNGRSASAGVVVQRLRAEAMRGKLAQDLLDLAADPALLQSILQAETDGDPVAMAVKTVFAEGR